MLFLKSKVKKYCNHVFTFPDGKKLYQIKEDYFEKLPAKKLLSIQENSNYIAYLGVSKATLQTGHKMIKEKAYEVKTYAKTKDLSKTDKSIDDIIRLIEQIDTNREQYDATNEAILVSMFDLFFYFEDENVFESNEQSIELKRHYLNEYPYFRSFFFQKLNAYMVAYKITFQNCINFALAQSTIQEIVKDLNLTNINEFKTP